MTAVGSVRNDILIIYILTIIELSIEISGAISTLIAVGIFWFGWATFSLGLNKYSLFEGFVNLISTISRFGPVPFILYALYRLIWKTNFHYAVTTDLKIRLNEMRSNYFCAIGFSDQFTYQRFDTDIF